MSGDDEPPMICDVCLGDSNRIRLTKNTRGSKCKICTLPFTVYHFKANKDVNLTKTLICTKCAKQRNICQCCMLDMTWHIPLLLRDRMLSLINKDKSMITEEVKNDMMKKFLALKDVELGGARVTSDPTQVDLLMNKLQDILTKKAVPHVSDALVSQEKTPSQNKLDKFKSVDVSHVLRKIPFKDSFDLETPAKSFFLYNLNTSIPEWRINQTIAQIVGMKDWQDQVSNSLILNHKAKCGGVRFKSDDLGLRFTEALLQSNSFFKTCKGLQRGILKIDHFQIFIIPWKSGFSTSSFGSSVGENIKLSLSLDHLIKIDFSSNSNDTVELATRKTGSVTEKKKIGRNNSKGAVTKKKTKVRRVPTLEL